MSKSLNTSQLKPGQKKTGKDFEPEAFVKPGVSLDDIREVKEVAQG